jgi:agmatine deiminase
VTLADVQRDYARVAAAIARFEPVKMVVDPSAMASARALCGANIELIELAVDDSWCRDSGPSFVCHPQHGLAGLSWRFNAWGGKSHHSLDRSLADASSTSWAWTVSAPRCATKAARSMWMAKAR